MKGAIPDVGHRVWGGQVYQMVAFLKSVVGTHRWPLTRWLLHVMAPIVGVCLSQPLRHQLSVSHIRGQ